MGDDDGEVLTSVLVLLTAGGVDVAFDGALTTLLLVCLKLDDDERMLLARTNASPLANDSLSRSRLSRL